MAIVKVNGELTTDEFHSNEDLRSFLLANIPLFGGKWRTHMPLFLGPAEVARILWLNEVYLKIIDVPGCVVEFGSQYGASLNTLNSLQLIHDTFNTSRKLLSFSTFEEGFVNTTSLDNKLNEEGDYATPEIWEQHILQILKHNSDIAKYQPDKLIVAGDASLTFPAYLEDNPHALFALVHFDMDIYKPTCDVLENIVPRLSKGSVLVFDELNCDAFPGETLAIMEVLDLHNIRLIKSKYQPYSAYCIF